MGFDGARSPATTTLAPFVVCPETLGPLEAVDGGFWSPLAERLYPHEQGLVFMGYPAMDQAMVAATMQEERKHQGLGAEVAARNLAYLRANAPRAVDFINLVTPFVQELDRQPRALELGCGNGWVSWLIAEAGFETWMCDFEANTLATGMNLEHPNLGEGKRFVTDARYAPFESRSIDLVVFKEFMHHVADYRPLFLEANRVLRVGGTMAMMEPIRSVWRSVRELRHPDPHEGHHITWVDSYLRAIRAAGMKIVHQTPVYDDHGNTRQPAAWMKKRALAAIDEDRPTGDLLSKLQLRLFGGAQMLIVAHKTDDLPPRHRPPMKVIDPRTLVASDRDIAGYREFPSVLREAATGLDRLSVSHTRD
jgi:SAM-dependent methyltransferase